MVSMDKKIKFTTFQKRIELLSVIALCFLAIYLVASWSSIPARIPAHYDVNGLIDGWGNKNSLLAMPGICLVLYAVLTIVSFFPKTWNIPVKLTDENRIRVYTATRTLLCVLKLILIIVFTVITITMAKLQEPGTFFFAILFGGVFGVIGGSVVKIIKVSKPQ
jgi:uncharacterized membrane protein